MDATPDYSKCSPRELQDVAARINKAKFPERYALVLREIERREMAGDDAATATAKKPITVWDNLADPIHVICGALAGAFIGIILLSFSSVEPNPDSPDGIPEMMGAVIVGAIIGKIVARIRGAGDE